MSKKEQTKHIFHNKVSTNKFGWVWRDLQQKALNVTYMKIVGRMMHLFQWLIHFHLFPLRFFHQQDLNKIPYVIADKRKLQNNAEHGGTSRRKCRSAQASGS